MRRQGIGGMLGFRDPVFTIEGTYGPFSTLHFFSYQYQRHMSVQRRVETDGWGLEWLTDSSLEIYWRRLVPAISKALFDLDAMQKQWRHSKVALAKLQNVYLTIEHTSYQDNSDCRILYDKDEMPIVCLKHGVCSCHQFMYQSLLAKNHDRDQLFWPFEGIERGEIHARFNVHVPPTKLPADLDGIRSRSNAVLALVEGWIANDPQMLRKMAAKNLLK